MSKEDVRRRLMEIGAELVHLQGFNHTGIQEILRTAGVPKGSFYFYFDNKEDFGLQLVDHYGGQFRAAVAEVDAGGGPIEELRRIFQVFIDYFQRHGYTRGCPVGNLAQEMGDLSPPFRKRLRETIREMAEPIRYRIARAQETGRIRKDIDPGETALFIVSAWHGALLRMKVEKSPEPYRLFEKFVFDHLLSK
jgi:TetR/AcrR family transcriptional repressor of nem operon